MEQDLFKEKAIQNSPADAKGGEKMKEVYTKPVCTVDEFEPVDVLTASPPTTEPETTTKPIGYDIVDGGED